jgi:hypothetical protein
MREGNLRYQKVEISSRSTRASLSAASDSDFAVVGLWSALGLCVSTLFMMAGFAGAFQGIAW